MKKESIEGELTITEQEGGYADSSVRINGASLSNWITMQVGKSRVMIDKGYVEVGRYRVTLEKLP